MTLHLNRYSRLVACGICVVASTSAVAIRKPKDKDPNLLRDEYVARLSQRYVAPSDSHTMGSLWSADAQMGDFASDYKAHRLNDTITIQVAVQTTAAQSGTVDSERTFSANSAITGVLGNAPVSTNPLLAAKSSHAIKGQGSTGSNTQFATNMTGQVISVLPNGNMILEARRNIFMNNQHEDVVVRGMIRPADIGPGNIVPSAALSDLQIEMKGKGIISDGVRSPNALTRTILWLLSF